MNTCSKMVVLVRHIAENKKVFLKIYVGSGGIRTNTSEETVALNQRF